MNEANTCGVPPTRLTLMDKLFPSRWCELPEAPATFKDCLHLDLTIGISFPDRIRLLFSGRAAVRIKCVCENEVGSSVASSVFYPVKR